MVVDVSDSTTTADAPLLRVVRGELADEELAALVVVLFARARGGAGEQGAQRSAWASYWNSHRAPLAPGAGAWRASALPR